MARARSQSKLSGIKELRRGLRQAPEALRAAVLEEIEEVTQDVHRDGLRYIDFWFTKQSGALRKYYKRRVQKKSLRGWVGYRGKKAKREAFYHRFLHDGTVNLPARPFHDRAVARHVEAYRRSMQAAARLVLRRTVK